jgi:hypothetical protein
MVAAVVVCLCVCWIFFAWPRATSFISFRSFHFFSLFSSLAFAKHRKKGFGPRKIACCRKHPIMWPRALCSSWVPPN